jgi:hypothetical protein
MSNKAINDEIERAQAFIAKLDPKSADYKRAVESLEVLCRTRDLHLKTGIFKVPPEYIAAVVNLTGIILVLHYEKFEVITSKAFAWIGKIRL